ncbi:hypothetical protein D9M69_525440 [compost metagenome]
MLAGDFLVEVGQQVAGGQEGGVLAVDADHVRGGRLLGLANFAGGHVVANTQHRLFHDHFRVDVQALTGPTGLALDLGRVERFGGAVAFDDVHLHPTCMGWWEGA